MCQDVGASLPASIGNPAQTLADALELKRQNDLFPWQRELLHRFLVGDIPSALDIPTGLGKTAVMAIWLVARAFGAPLPRRLVYVVDRRAVVDQATTVAESLRTFVERTPQLQNLLGLDGRSLPISTLRGQHVDNRAWLEDPATPAIVVGTVDMIGSRLLFQGYGVSPRMRPYHAAMLGVDALVTLDEAHLVPPFEKLLDAIAQDCEQFGPQGEERRALIPAFRLLPLSATGRRPMSDALRLGPADRKHPVAKRRLNAPKHLELRTVEERDKLVELLADAAWELTDSGSRPIRCIVFCDSRRDAEKCKNAIEKRIKSGRSADERFDTVLFVGARRVRERKNAAERLKCLGFLATKKAPRSTPAFLFATSAAEVGVDLDADCMTCDLVAWERMVQRLGRVNRRGDVPGGARIVVFADGPGGKTQDALGKKPAARTSAEKKLAAAYLAKTGALELLRYSNGAIDASPAAILQVTEDARTDSDIEKAISAATTEEPLRPELTRALVDAWAMTSLDDHPGRPRIVDPWLRGWREREQSQTRVVWRRHLPIRTEGADVTRSEIEGFFKAARPHLSEVLEDDTRVVIEWLTKRVGALCARSRKSGTSTEPDANHAPFDAETTIAIVLTPSGKHKDSLSPTTLIPPQGKRLLPKQQKEALIELLGGATLVVDADLAGLNEDGLLDIDVGEPPRTADDNSPEWMEPSPRDDEPTVPVIRFRVRPPRPDEHSTTEPTWQERYRFTTAMTEDGEPAGVLAVDGWLGDAAEEDDRSVAFTETLQDHVQRVERRGRRLAESLELSDDFASALAVAATLHDEGKATQRWQQAFNAPTDGPAYGKTKGPFMRAILDGYRHELGTLVTIADSAGLGNLAPDLHELVLHLIAAHHGFARPFIATRSCEDAPPSVLDACAHAQEIALRFARLQRQWGPWGLAWLEMLLRAADQQASREAVNEASAKASV